MTLYDENHLAQVILKMCFLIFFGIPNWLTRYIVAVSWISTQLIVILTAMTYKVLLGHGIIQLLNKLFFREALK